MRASRCASTIPTPAPGRGSPTGSPRSPRSAAATPTGRGELAGASIGATDAFRIGATDGVRPTIGELIVRLDGKTVTTAAGEVKLSTATVVGTGRDRRRQPNQEVRFRRLGLDGQVLHRLISPSIAYFLLVAGLALLVFEFYTAGVGLAGLVGAICVVGAFVGFSHLPVHWWAFALLLFATFGFAIDVQVGSVGVWTVIGTVALGVGSLFLYGGSSELRPAWWVLLVVFVGMILFMVGGMTAMIRSRFSTPTIGREGMIGEVGTAEVAIDPDGVVLIRGARWRADQPRDAARRRRRRARRLGGGSGARGGAARGRGPRLPRSLAAGQERQERITRRRRRRLTERSCPANAARGRLPPRAWPRGSRQARRGGIRGRPHTRSVARTGSVPGSGDCAVLSAHHR